MILFRNVRISVYSDTLMRVEYQPDGQFEDRPTLLMGTAIPPEIPASVQEKGERLVVRTGKCCLTYEKKGDDFNRDRLEVQFLHGQERRTWNRQTRHSRPGRAVYRSLDEWKHGLERLAVPILINDDGWHVIEDTAGVYWDAQRDWPVVKRQPYYQNLYLFFFGTDIRQAFRDFITLFGPPPLMPRQAFGAWYSRWYDYKDHELLDLISTYRQLDLPLDVLVVDVDWHTHHWNGYDWRKTSFLQPEQFIRQVREAGLKLVLNDHPGYGANDPLPEEDSRLSGLQAEIGEAPYKGMWACDWSRRSVVDKWSRYCLQDLLRQGLDWWWIDGWGDTSFPGVDSQLWLNWQYYRATQDAHPGRRALILSRWGGLGSHRYPIQFSGDTHANFDTLAFQVPFTAWSGGLGAAYWSHDIGGFHEGTIDEELYIRWVQFGALSPIFRTHSNHGVREPYRFSPRALAVYRKFLHFRYQLVPYLEQLQHTHHLTGFPPVAPLDFVHPESREALIYPDQYYLGPSVLVAPVTRPLAERRPSLTRLLWLPPGSWLDAISGNWIEGARVLRKRVTLEEMPLFIKGGSIIPAMPLQFPLPVGPYPEVNMNLFRPRGKHRETFYFDDGESVHHFRGEEISRLVVGYEVRNEAIRLDIRVDPGHTRKFLPRKLTFRLYLPGEVRTIKKNGRTMTWQPSNQGFIDRFPRNHLDAVQWTIDGQDLPAQTTYTLALHRSRT